MAGRVDVADDMFSVFIHGLDMGDARLDKANSQIISGMVIIAFKVFAEGSDVDIENGRVQTVVAVLFGENRLLDGIGAADAGTVSSGADVGISGTHALQPGNFFGLLFIRRSHQMPAIGSGSRQDSFKLQAGDNIVE